MSIKRFKPLLLQLLDVTHGLVTGPNTRHSQFAEVLEGTFRRDYVAALAILKLSEENDGRESPFGETCMALTRRMLEDVVSIEYMLFKGKEKMAEKFKAFRDVELKWDLEYLQSAEITLSEKTSQMIEGRYRKAKELFRDGKDPQFWKNRRSWAGISTEQMITDLADAGVLSELEKTSMIHMHGTTSGRLHFSPSGVLEYIHEELFSSSNQRNLNLSVFIATSALSKLAMRFINEIEVDEKTRKVVNDIWQEVSRLKPPQPSDTKTPKQPPLD